MVYPSFALVSDFELDDPSDICGGAAAEVDDEPLLRVSAVKRRHIGIAEDECIDASSEEADMSDMERTVMSVLRQLDDADRYLSGFVHRLELGRGDYLALIPNAFTGVVGVPLIALAYLHTQESWLYVWNVALITILNEVAKAIFKRPRPHPKSLGKKMFDLRSIHKTGAMPSGDAAQAAVAAMFLIRHGYSWWWYAPLTLIGSFGRVYFGAHWIGDCAVGVAYGTLSAYLLNEHAHPFFSAVKLWSV
jgi:membrane-associated phospholipid phosphatase